MTLTMMKATFGFEPRGSRRGYLAPSGLRWRSALIVGPELLINLRKGPFKALRLPKIVNNSAGAARRFVKNFLDLMLENFQSSSASWAPDCYEHAPSSLMIKPRLSASRALPVQRTLSCCVSSATHKEFA